MNKNKRIVALLLVISILAIGSAVAAQGARGGQAQARGDGRCGSGGNCGNCGNYGNDGNRSAECPMNGDVTELSPEDQAAIALALEKALPFEQANLVKTEAILSKLKELSADALSVREAEREQFRLTRRMERLKELAARLNIEVSAEAAAPDLTGVNNAVDVNSLSEALKEMEGTRLKFYTELVGGEQWPMSLRQRTAGTCRSCLTPMGTNDCGFRGQGMPEGGRGKNQSRGGGAPGSNGGRGRR